MSDLPDEQPEISNDEIRENQIAFIMGIGKSIAGKDMGREHAEWLLKPFLFYFDRGMDAGSAFLRACDDALKAIEKHEQEPK